MKKQLVTILVMLIAGTMNAQIKSFESDVKTIDALMRASYEVVSGEKGAPRQWERDNYLHHPKAVYSFYDKRVGQQTMTLDEFHAETDTMVFDTDFYEEEIHREVKLFGNIAHVWSTYETRLEKNGPVARRGINSVQLVFENDRWYIISWTFFGETELDKIPKTFLPN